MIIEMVIQIIMLRVLSVLMNSVEDVMIDFKMKEKPANNVRLIFKNMMTEIIQLIICVLQHQKILIMRHF